MIATQLYPAPTFQESRDRDATQYLPAKDLESFKKLLPPPIEFVEGSSSGTLALGDGKYSPINGPSKLPPRSELPEPASPQSPATPHSSATPQAPPSPAKSLWTRPIDISWPPSIQMGCGLNNTGNTCFLNSALQCLIHTPPLVRVLIDHSTNSDPCRVKKGAFCMSCSLRGLMRECFEKRYATTPYQITTKLGEIAKHMRRGRQEDSHEFLRYAIDALQKSCLAGYPPKIDHKLAVTTWVHRIFGGQLRSRVTCLSCGYNSDTFDDILDLSVDIYGVDTLQKALRKFVEVDHLRGNDKYKCDKCKKHVSADKSFTVHEAPMVLSVHLKRFSPMGRKIGQPIRYDEHLSLQPVMSEGQHGPTYSLYGVISHAGGGPNSGHYYTHIKNAAGQWHEMNDEVVTREANPPTNMKNAYILFYIRDKGQALEAAVAAPVTASAAQRKYMSTPSAPPRTGLVAGMKKRKVPEDDGATPKPFIGPQLPPPSGASPSSPETKKQKPNPPDPQARVLKQKIAAVSHTQPQSAANASPVKALLSLSQYRDDDDDEDIGEKVDEKATEETPKMEGGQRAPPHSSSPQSPSPTLTEPSLPSLSSTTASTASLETVPASSFYGSSIPSKSRINPDSLDDRSLSEWARTPITDVHTPKRPPPSHRHSALSTVNPFTRLNGSNNLRQSRDSGKALHGKRHKKRSVAI